MNPLVYLLAVVGVAAVVVLVLALRSGSGEEAQIEQRLDQYAETDAADFGTARDLEDEAKRLSRLTQGLNAVVEKRGFGTRIAQRLAQASIKLTVAEYLILSFIGIIVGGGVGWLVFGSNFLFVSGFVVGFFVPRIVVNIMKGQRLRKFNDQLGDTINLLVNSLRSGYSMPQAMDTVANNMPAPISEEFRRVGIEVTLGLTLEDALGNMLRRVDSADLDLMITAINVQHEVGGNLAEILDIISHTIRERVRIQGEIKTLTAQGEITGYVISGLPFAQRQMVLPLWLGWAFFALAYSLPPLRLKERGAWGLGFSFVAQWSLPVLLAFAALGRFGGWDMIVFASAITVSGATLEIAHQRWDRAHDLSTQTGTLGTRTSPAKLDQLFAAALVLDRVALGAVLITMMVKFAPVAVGSLSLSPGLPLVGVYVVLFVAALYETIRASRRGKLLDPYYDSQRSAAKLLHETMPNLVVPAYLMVLAAAYQPINWLLLVAFLFWRLVLGQADWLWPWRAVRNWWHRQRRPEMGP